jgi:hypothetical protein
MGVPASSAIQLVNPGSATFSVDAITDPNGAPSNVIDVDDGFEVTGKVTMPGWMTGDGEVCIYADELGGPIDKKIGCVAVAITGDKVDEKKAVTYDWKIVFPGNPPVLPDPSTGSQLYHLAAVFTFNGQMSDIAGFVEMGLYLIN